MRGSFCSIINKLLENYTLQNFKGGRGRGGCRGIDWQHLVSLTVPSNVEVKLSCDVIFMFCDVLLYQMHVKYQKFRLLR